jgi:hypothetical protein
MDFPQEGWYLVPLRRYNLDKDFGERISRDDQ